MNDFAKRIGSLFKNPKLLMILGLIGIFLIFLSSFLPSGDGETAVKNQNETDTESYRAALQEDVSRIVERITGDDDCTVVITLESGVRYTYAEAGEDNTSSSSGQNLEENSSSSTKSYITVKTADGGEQALLVTQTMPQVRGVAVVCDGGDNSETAEKITAALTAALDITSKRVYVTGGNTYEKG